MYRGGERIIAAYFTSSRKQASKLPLKTCQVAAEVEFEKNFQKPVQTSVGWFRVPPFHM
jgi:hypothetical protein